MSGLSFGSASVGAQQTRAPGFAGSKLALRPRLQSQRRSTQLRVVSERVLIANTKGGGHAFIGLHLAQQLLSKGHEVTILNDGEEVGRSGSRSGSSDRSMWTGQALEQIL